MLKDFVESTLELIKIIEQNENLVIGVYFIKEPYLESELIRKGLKIFNVEEVVSGILRNKK